MVKKTFFTIFVFFLISISFVSAWNFEGNNVKIIEPTDANGDLEVQIQDYNGKIVSFFLTQTLQESVLSSSLEIMDNTATIDNVTGCLVGDALDIWDGNNYFQGIITDKTDDVLTFTPSIDYAYDSTDSYIKCGEWNLNVNGATNPIDFSIKPPYNSKWDIESIGMLFQDNLDWDISTFGSRTALSNGFVVGVENGIITKLFLIYNNGGFMLRGGNVQNVEKAPAGVYSFNIDMEFESKYGAILKLDGTLNESLVATIQDDLTSQSEIAFTLRGHYKDE